MRIRSLQVGKSETLSHPDPIDARKPEWRTAFYKKPIPGPVWAGTLLLEGDNQADKRYHGGSDKAINAYSFDHYDFWKNELSLDALAPAAFGENLTLDDASEAEVCIGDSYDVGGARLEVSQPRQPCWKLCRRWNRLELARIMEENGKSGWYFRVLKEGLLAIGDTLKLVDRPYPRWTILAANSVMHGRDRKDHQAATDLAAVPPLAQSWKEVLSRRKIRASQ